MKYKRQILGILGRILFAIVIALIFLSVKDKLLEKSDELQALAEKKKIEAKNRLQDEKKSREEQEGLVPDVIGLDLDSAISAIEKKKCEVGEVTYEYSDAKAGTVIDQSPEGGEASRAFVNLVVSSGSGRSSSYNYNYSNSYSEEPEQGEKDKEEEKKPEEIKDQSDQTNSGGSQSTETGGATESTGGASGQGTESSGSGQTGDQ